MKILWIVLKAWKEERKVSYPHPLPNCGVSLIVKIGFPRVSFTGAILPNAIAPAYGKKSTEKSQS